MAFDVAMLKQALYSAQPILRVYQWQPYCISLGYHQSPDSIDLEKCLKDQIDIVRRPTGGRAVLHAEEVTYCVVIPNNSSFYSSSIQESYQKISHALVRGIQKLGISADLQKQSLNMKAHYQKKESMSCFSAVSRNEVMIEYKKLIGSAQRQFPEGLLQHGSILLGNKHLELPNYYRGLSDSDRDKMIKQLEKKTVALDAVYDHPAQYDKICSILKEGFEEAFQIQFEDLDEPIEVNPSDLDTWHVLKS